MADDKLSLENKIKTIKISSNTKSMEKLKNLSLNIIKKLDVKIDILAKSLNNTLEKIDKQYKIINNSTEFASNNNVINDKWNTIITPLIDKMDTWATKLTRNNSNMQKEFCKMELGNEYTQRNINKTNKNISTIDIKIDQMVRNVIKNQVITQTKLAKIEREFINKHLHLKKSKQ